jgi:hypothetical protein
MANDSASPAVTQSLGSFHVAAPKVRRIGGRRSDDNDRCPIVRLMNGPIERLARQHDDECKCKERQSTNVAQPQIVGEKSPMFAPKMLARQSAVQYRPASEGGLAAWGLLCGATFNCDRHRVRV